MTSPLPKFWSGDKVRKIGGDYRFEGVVVSAFTKLSGARRYVVEDDRGILHIFNEGQLEAASIPRVKAEVEPRAQPWCR